MFTHQHQCFEKAISQTGQVTNSVPTTSNQPANDYQSQSSSQSSESTLQVLPVMGSEFTKFHDCGFQSQHEMKNTTQCHYQTAFSDTHILL